MTTDLKQEARSHLSRRDLVAVLGAVAAGLPASETAMAQGSSSHEIHAMPAHWVGKEEIALLIYPGFTALDMMGPHYMFASLMGASVHIVAKTLDPVKSDQGMHIVPSHSFESCPRDLDILFAPGGSSGTLAAMQDASTIAFLGDRGARAKLVTSVCTGSLLLGAAGLLRGYRATSHWVARDLLREFGAEPVDQRVVADRNRITGAGVTAGLDFGLTIVSKLRDEKYAKGVQLLAEYQPDPPFDAGSPGRAGREVTNLIAGMFTSFDSNVRALARRDR